MRAAVQIAVLPIPGKPCSTNDPAPAGQARQQPVDPIQLGLAADHRCAISHRHPHRPHWHTLQTQAQQTQAQQTHAKMRRATDARGRRRAYRPARDIERGYVRGPAYLVERYLNRQHVADLVAAVSRLAEACREYELGAAPVRYLQATFVPAEDTCFLPAAGSSSVSAVRAVNTTANFAFDRISVAQIIHPSG